MILQRIINLKVGKILVENHVSDIENSRENGDQNNKIRKLRGQFQSKMEKLRVQEVNTFPLNQLKSKHQIHNNAT